MIGQYWQLRTSRDVYWIILWAAHDVRPSQLNRGHWLHNGRNQFCQLWHVAARNSTHNLLVWVQCCSKIFQNKMSLLCECKYMTASIYPWWYRSGMTLKLPVIIRRQRFFHHTSLWLPMVSYMAGWWFGTFLIFPYIGNFIIPIDELIFFRGVAQPPTRWYPTNCHNCCTSVYNLQCSDHEEPMILWLPNIYIGIEFIARSVTWMCHTQGGAKSGYKLDYMWIIHDSSWYLIDLDCAFWVLDRFDDLLKPLLFGPSTKPRSWHRNMALRLRRVRGAVRMPRFGAKPSGWPSTNLENREPSWCFF